MAQSPVSLHQLALVNVSAAIFVKDLEQCFDFLFNFLLDIIRDVSEFLVVLFLRTLKIQRELIDRKVLIAIRINGLEDIPIVFLLQSKVAAFKKPV